MVAVAVTLCALGYAADAGLLFRASFDDTVEAEGKCGPLSPAAVEGPAQPEFAPGRFGQALVCGPGATLVRYPTEGNVIPPSGTVSLWVQPVNWSPDDENFHSFFESGSEAAGTGWLILYKYYQNGWLLLRYAEGKTKVGMATAADLGWQPGQWHHIAGTWSAEAMRIYVDGELVGEAPAPLVSQTLGETFALGDNGWHLPHEGARTLLDEVRIYAYPLPEERIRELALSQRMDISRDPAGGVWHVTMGVAEEAAPARVIIELAPAEGGEPLRSVEVTPAEGQARADLAVADLAPGEYLVTGRGLGEDGQVVAQARATMRRLEHETLELSNEQVRVVFDGGSGALSSVENLRTGASYREGGAAPPVFSLDTVGFEHAWFYQPADVRTVPADASALVASGIEDVEGAARLTMTWEYESGVRATMTATLPDDEQVVSLQLGVQCPRPLWPSTAVRVPSARFPVIGGLQIGETAEDDILA
ncbi:MAG TPA: LamG domain-containing protein, partial [Armatimonadota bacterium]|nr:LamG domain-containing protein [Armatimonadota bacterium]